MRKIIFLSLLVVLGMIFLVSCAPAELKSEEDLFLEEVSGDSALAGQAVQLRCQTRSVISCEDNGDGSYTVNYEGRRGAAAVTRIVRNSCLSRADASVQLTLNVNCASSTSVQFCTNRCESGESCQNGQCIAPCGNGVVNVGENCATCAADVHCAEGQVCASEACTWCGNGIIDAGETCSNCATDVICSAEQSCINEVCVACTPESTLVVLREGQRLSAVKPVLTATCDLPELLASGYARSRDTTPSTEQELFFTNQNSGFVNANSNLFIRAGDTIATYVLSFEPSWSSLESDLSDFRGSQLRILGREYVVVFAEHPLTAPELGIRLVLMARAVADTLLEGESRSYVVNGMNYITALVFVDPDECRFNINGELTNKLKVGDYYILPDGTAIGVGDLLYQDYAGGLHSCTFHLGSQIIELRSDQIEDGVGTFSARVGAEDVDGTSVVIMGTSEEDRFDIDRIEINMIAEDSFNLGPGRLLSEVIREANQEAQVLFTNDWDIRLSEHNPATNTQIVEIGRLCPLD